MSEKLFLLSERFFGFFIPIWYTVSTFLLIIVGTEYVLPNLSSSFSKIVVIIAIILMVFGFLGLILKETKLNKQNKNE